MSARFWLPLVSFLALAGAAQAASFDCAKATSALEKRVCADPALSAADERMATAYRAARAVSPTPLALRREQRNWLSSGLEEDTDLVGAYDARTVFLKRAADSAAAVRRPVSIASLTKQCAPLLVGDNFCTVDATGTVQVTAGAPWLWQQQSLRADDLDTGRPVVLLKPSADGRTATPVLWRAEDTASFEEPELVKSPVGPLLVLVGYYAGTGNYNAGSVFRVSGEALTEIDADTWVEQLGKRLPKELAVWKGMYIDFDTLTVSSPLWRSDDGNCCPTGGRVDAKLRIAGDAVVIDSFKVTRGAKAAEGF